MSTRECRWGRCFADVAGVVLCGFCVYSNYSNYNAYFASMEGSVVRFMWKGGKMCDKFILEPFMSVCLCMCERVCECEWVSLPVIFTSFKDHVLDS